MNRKGMATMANSTAVAPRRSPAKRATSGNLRICPGPSLICRQGWAGAAVAAAVTVVEAMLKAGVAAAGC
jgi:hypothetical protein